MDGPQALQNLLNGTASEEEIEMLKGRLSSGEISIGGDINHSVLIQGSENNVQVFQLTPEILELLGGRQFLGNLDRDLTGDEIAAGLNRIEAEFPQRAPILLIQLQELTRRLRPLLKTNPKSLSDHAHREWLETLAQINRLCIEALDISFNALCLGEEPPEYDSRSPFRGLESFRPEDSGFFFGREELTKKLVDKINSHPFLAVLGASGSGKSSLVMAGLIPALGSEYIVLRPGTNPLEKLVEVKENILVVVDQFEELFTLTKDESTRKEFITKLLEVRKRNKVVITLRSDFLGEVAAYRNLNEDVQSHLENVPPMDMDELRRAMEGQANTVGLRFEADLSQQILDDVEGEPGAMPLLQHTLWELWNRRHGHNLCASEYRAFGGVKQAIASTAEKVYSECTKAEQEQLRDIFLRLVRLDEDNEGRDTRRRAAINDLIPSGQDIASVTFLLDKLANARLIVKTVNNGRTEIEVAHEALIRHWERLRRWLNEDRDNLRLREAVGDAARQWESSGRKDEGLFFSGWRLQGILSLSAKYALNEHEKAFVAASVISERGRKFQKIGLRLAVAALLIILAILGPGRWAYYEYQRQGIISSVPLVAFEGGEIVFGTNSPERSEDEPLLQAVQVEAFGIERTEVTNANYEICVAAGFCDEPNNKIFYDNPDLGQHPVVYVSFGQAETYCTWLGRRLPTTYEWERAARGQKGRSWPWGETSPTPDNANTLILLNSETQEWSEPKETVEVASLKHGATPDGVYDLVGNVWEWTSTQAGDAYILRGGSWDSIVYRITNSRRSVGSEATPSVGFRCAY